jgi:hypothetical protein
MAAVSETIVREYFELNGFLVRQFRKYVAPAVREEDDIDFLVINPNPRPHANELPFLLNSEHLKSIERGVVILKAWHTDVFSPALLTNTPDFFRFLENKTFGQASSMLGTPRTPLKILVVPSLPQATDARNQSIGILRGKGLDAAISFPTMLGFLVNQVEPNRNYQKSDVLQLIRILKNYEFLKGPELDLFRPKRKRARRLNSSAGTT